jgi:hypothetical protein
MVKSTTLARLGEGESLRISRALPSLHGRCRSSAGSECHAGRASCATCRANSKVGLTEAALPPSLPDQCGWSLRGTSSALTLGQRCRQKPQRIYYNQLCAPPVWRYGLLNPAGKLAVSRSCSKAWPSADASCAIQSLAKTGERDRLVAFCQAVSYLGRGFA